MVIDFRKLNKATRKNHYALPSIDQMLERLSKYTHLLLSRWLFWFLSNTCVKRGSGEDHFYEPFCYLWL